MKKTLKLLIGLSFLGLIIANIFIFVSEMNLGQQVSYFEQETGRLHKQNLVLQQKAYAADSLQYAASVAAKLNFAQKAEPYFLENLGFALRK